MHSAWNSCPQGKLMTLLTPSTYSSRQTTHSLCFPPYRFRHSDRPAARFSSIVSSDGEAISSERSDEPGWTGTSGVVRDRGLGRVLIGRAVEGKSGVDALTGEEIDEVAELVAVVLGIV